MLGSIKSFAKQALTLASRANNEDRVFTAVNSSSWQDVTSAKAAPTLFKENLQVLVVGVETASGTTIHTIRALAPFTKPTIPAR
jgi:hypothetical protein